MAEDQQAVVGYACEFVDAIPKELQTECSICLHVLRDPHMVDCCGYRFCRRCIDRVLYEFKTCPLCNHKQPRTIADKQLSRTLRQKRVKCTHKEEGCKWTGELAALDEHLALSKRVEGCFFKSLLCAHCNIPYRKSLIEDHESKCLKKTVVCEYCKVFQCLRHELSQHWESCGHYPIVCPRGCGAKVTRLGLYRHFEASCPFTVVDCEYAYAGCDIRVSRKCMREHMNQSMKDHLALLTKKYSKLQLEHERERENNRQLEINLEEQKDKVREKSGKDEETALLKRLCALRSEDDFDAPNDQVVIENLPTRANEQMIKSLFGQHGPIFAVRLYSSSIAVVEYESNDSIGKLFHKYNSTGIRLLGSQLRCVHLGY